MHNFILKFFNFLKSCLQFLKILIVFLIMMITLYWAQQLSGNYWAWASFLDPVLDVFLDLGDLITPGAITVFSVVFKLKFITTILIFILMFYFCNLIAKFFEKMEDLYSEGRKIIRKIEEYSVDEIIE